MNHSVPRSPYARVNGLVYFGRMLDKIRLHERGELRPDLVPNLGMAFDAICSEFLGVAYEEIRLAVMEGKSDEEVLAWCRERGRALDDRLIWLWNLAMTKRGWRDDLTERLRQRLAEGGFTEHPSALTMFDYIDLDEGRDPEVCREQ